MLTTPPLTAAAAAPSPSPERVAASLRWIMYDRALILRQDFSDLSEEEVLTLIDHANDEILRSDATTIRELIVITGLKISKRMLDYATEATKRIAHRRPASAIVGVTGVQRLILQMFNRFSATPLVPFSTEAEACAWLAAQGR